MEMTATKALEERDRNLYKLVREYRERFDNLPVNSFGETSAEALLKLNEWYREEEKRINQIMFDRLNMEVRR